MTDVKQTDAGAGLVPRPKEIVVNAGNYALLPNTIVAHQGDSATQRAASLLVSELRRIAVRNVICRLARHAPKAFQGISIIRAKNMPAIHNHPEGFEISISPKAVAVRALRYEGLFYAIQALLSLLEHKQGQWGWPACALRDWPDCAWRGFMLDPPNGFYPLERVKRILDWMAAGRLNALHVHLTDNALVSIAVPGIRNLSKRVYCALPNVGHPFWREDLEEWE